MLSIAADLASTGQWEAGWAVEQIHYDQFLKEEAGIAKRQHKGHPACGLAIPARELGSPSLTHHYALFSSAGDVYWKHIQPDLEHGGYAPTMLEQFESGRKHATWRDCVGTNLQQFNLDEPVFLEALASAPWFGSRAHMILDLAKVPSGTVRPFCEILLDAVESQKEGPWTIPGTRFEAAVGLLLDTTPGFQVDSGRQVSDKQIDLVVRYSPDRLGELGLDTSFGLVECKASKEPVSVKELRSFGATCLFHRVKFGILVARAGITGGTSSFAEPQHAELVRRRFQADGLTILVLSLAQLRN